MIKPIKCNVDYTVLPLTGCPVNGGKPTTEIANLNRAVSSSIRLLNSMVKL